VKTNTNEHEDFQRKLILSVFILKGRKKKRKKRERKRERKISG